MRCQVDRHRARWAVAGAEKPMPLFKSMERYEAVTLLKKPTEGQDIVADYQSTGLTLGGIRCACCAVIWIVIDYVTAEQLPACYDGSAHQRGRAGHYQAAARNRERRYVCHAGG